MRSPNAFLSLYSFLAWSEVAVAMAVICSFLNFSPALAFTLMVGLPIWAILSLLLFSVADSSTRNRSVSSLDTGDWPKDAGDRLDGADPIRQERKTDRIAGAAFVIETCVVAVLLLMAVTGAFCILAQGPPVNY